MTKTMLSVGFAALMFTGVLSAPLLSGAGMARADDTAAERPFDPTRDTVDPDTGEIFHATPARTGASASGPVSATPSPASSAPSSAASRASSTAPTSYKLYVKAGGGYNYLDHQDYTVSEASFVGGYGISGAVGYKFDNNLRVEGEITYRANRIDRIKSAAGPYLDQAGGDITSTAFMGNVYYDIPTDVAIKPYVGGGIGYAMVDASYEQFSAEIQSISDDIFAYQAIVGSDFDISDSFALYLEYKYFKTDDVLITPANQEGEYKHHSIFGGLKFKFQ